MKKNRGILTNIAGRTALIGFLLVICCAASAYTAEAEFNIRQDGDLLYVSVTLPEGLRPDVVTSLNSGLRSEISFEVKVYRQTGGFRSIFGDALVMEDHITWEGKRDNFGKSYQISGDTETRTFSDPEVFLDHYFSLSEHPLTFWPEGGGEYYILSRITVEEVKLVPPLNILTPFLHKNRTVTDWHRRDIRLEGGPGT